MNIRVNDTVKIATGGYESLFRGQTGNVKAIYIGVAIVEMSDGTTLKVCIDDLVKVEPRETANTVQEGAVEITNDQFMVALIQATDPFNLPSKNAMSNIYGSLTGVLVGHNVADKIFKDQSAVTMTEDEFVSALWDGCSPANVTESIDGKMSSDRAISVSLAAMITLRKIVSIIFDDESDNV